MRHAVSRAGLVGTVANVPEGDLDLTMPAIGVLWVGASDVVEVILSKKHQHAPNGARHFLESKMLVLMR